MISKVTLTMQKNAAVYIHIIHRPK